MCFFDVCTVFPDVEGPGTGERREREVGPRPGGLRGTGCGSRSPQRNSRNRKMGTNSAHSCGTKTMMESAQPSAWSGL